MTDSAVSWGKPKSPSTCSTAWTAKAATLIASRVPTTRHPVPALEQPVPGGARASSTSRPPDPSTWVTWT